MPIYTYKCSSCGALQDVLRRISDPPLTQCPQCGLHTFDKQVTAAGFQLKGSGWYVTDFRNSNTTSTSKSSPDANSSGATGEAAASVAPAAPDATSPSPSTSSTPPTTSSPGAAS